MLSNVELVETFIQHSLQSKEVLLSNASFSAESLCGINQLTSRQSGLLIKIDLQQQPPQFHLRQNSPHTLLLQRLLNRHQFLVTEKGNGAFATYRYFSVQRGYQFNCNTARALWKNWRAIKRLSASRSKLLVKQGAKWSEVQSIDVSNELIFIETTDDKELVHNFEDAVQWLNKVA